MPTTLKLTNIATGECRRMLTISSFDGLCAKMNEIWGPNPFVLTYVDDDKDTVTVSCNESLNEALLVASAMGVNVFKLSVYPSREALLRDIKTKAEAHCQGPSIPKMPMAVHRGVTCDRSGMKPIVGPRFHVMGANYDLCLGEFNKLSEDEKVKFVKIEVPGTNPVSCSDGTPVAGWPLGCHRGGHRGGGHGFHGLRHGWHGGRWAVQHHPAVNVEFGLGLSAEEAALQEALAASLRRASDAAGCDSEEPKDSPLIELFSAFMGPEGLAAAQSFAVAMAREDDKKAPEAKPGSGNGTNAATSTSTRPRKDEEPARGANALAELMGALLTNSRRDSTGKGGFCGKGGKGKGSGKGGKSRMGKGASGGGVEAVHHGVTCDRSGMSPITGPRFHVLGSNYDLCFDEFMKLPEAERLLYVKIAFPGEEAEAMNQAEYSAEATAKVAATMAGNAACETDPSEAVKEPLESSVSIAVSKAAAEAAAEAEAEPSQARQEPIRSSVPTVGTDSSPRKVDPVGSPFESFVDVEAAVAVPTPAATVPPAALRYADELANLANLGFFDGDANVALLDRYKGRLDRVINALLDE